MYFPIVILKAATFLFAFILFLIARKAKRNGRSKSTIYIIVAGIVIVSGYFQFKSRESLGHASRYRQFEENYNTLVLLNYNGIEPSDPTLQLDLRIQAREQVVEPQVTGPFVLDVFITLAVVLVLNYVIVGTLRTRKEDISTS